MKNEKEIPILNWEGDWKCADEWYENYLSVRDNPKSVDYTQEYLGEFLADYTD